MDSSRELVFVYGTLRRGGSDHFRMASAKFITSGLITGRLYQVSWYPGLVLDDAGDEIAGEVYSVDSDMLGKLDSFEGISTDDTEGSEYRRVSTNVYHPDGGELTAWVWEWLGIISEDNRIQTGNWLA
jgi:gamma-glutamylcyclotransferase (GGCT)/AIG2-like uncharacterized protein YtfP